MDDWHEQRSLRVLRDKKTCYAKKPQLVRKHIARINTAKMKKRRDFKRLQGVQWEQQDDEDVSLETRVETSDWVLVANKATTSKLVQYYRQALDWLYGWLRR